MNKKMKSLKVYFIGTNDCFHNLNEKLQGMNELEIISDMSNADCLIVDNKYDNLVSNVNFEKSPYCISLGESNLKKVFSDKYLGNFSKTIDMGSEIKSSLEKLSKSLNNEKS